MLPLPPLTLLSLLALICGFPILVRADRDGLGVAKALPSYAAREDSYGVPLADTYGAPPADTYGAPLADTYGAPPSYAAPTGGLDLAVIIIPILALVGLFLLFPSFVNITTVRRRRRSEEDSDWLSRLQYLYDAQVALFSWNSHSSFRKDEIQRQFVGYI